MTGNPARPASRLPAFAAAAIALLYAAACAAFARQPGLASFADDSVSYLVMAQVFSPWQAAAAPVAEAFAREAFYPPLFPLVLALTGAAHDFAQAHVVTALLLAACLPALYGLAARWLASGWAAVAVVAVTALLPLPWIQAKGILSEPLFCLILLLLLRALDGGRRDGRHGIALAALMAALVLTRSVGLVVIAAYAAWALSRWSDPLRERLRALLPAAAAAVVYAGWVVLRPDATADDYLRIVLERVRLMIAADSPLAAFGHSLLRQASAIVEAWSGAVLLFWVEGRPLRVIFAGAVGALALAGLALRLAAGRPDAWLAAAYLVTFLLWPFYDQMSRFLFPVLPVLVLYAFAAAGAALRAAGRPPAFAHAILGLLLASLAAPGLGFIHQRAQASGRQVEITDWYRTPDLDRARARAQIHLDLMEDMAAIRELTRPQDRIMWVAPAYIALLAERRGVPAPAADLAPASYRQAVLAAGPDYLYLSSYHPRDTVRDTAWRTGMAAMAGHAEVVHARKSPAPDALSAALLRIEGARPAGVQRTRGRRHDRGAR